MSSILRSWCLLLALVLAVGAVACGGPESPASEESAAAGSPSPETKTYVNSEFDFAFDYDPAVIGGPKNVASPTPDTPGLLAMHFPAREGDGGVMLLAEELDGRMRKADADWIRKQLQPEIDALATYIDAEGSATPLADVETNGAWGFVTTLSFVEDDMPQQVRIYVLFRDTFRYQLRMASEQSRWDASEPCFDLVIDTFRPAE